MRVKRKEEKFNYILMCNKICGGAHYKMKMTVVVLAQNEYKAWMDSKKKATFRDTYFGAPSAPAVMDSLAAPSVDTTMVANVTMIIK